MTMIVLEIISVLLLFAANGVFAMMEMAVVSSRKSRLKQMGEAGDGRTSVALALAESPNRFLPVREIMTPRAKLVCLHVDDIPERVWRKIVVSGHSSYPVYDRDRDDVRGAAAQLKNLMAPPLFVSPVTSER